MLKVLLLFSGGVTCVIGVSTPITLLGLFPYSRDEPPRASLEHETAEVGQDPGRHQPR